MKQYLRLLVTFVLIIFCCSKSTLGTDEGPNFEAWLEDLHVDAISAGVKTDILASIIENIKFVPRVIELDRNQPEGRLTFAQYLQNVISEARIVAAQKRLKIYASDLEAVESDYEVQRRFIIALWGIESDFGRFTGGFSVIDSLATLAYDGRRSVFFRTELIEALRIISMGEIEYSNMKGSWAGAMGQCQFMPSSFHRFAEDYDKDGRRDIWHSLPDVFASISNYLNQSGWKFDQTWGRQVILPNDFDLTLVGLERLYPIGHWQALGVRRVDGSDLPKRQLLASIILPDGADNQAYMVYDNFRTIMKWNRSTYFALAVGRLSDQLIR